MATTQPDFRSAPDITPFAAVLEKFNAEVSRQLVAQLAEEEYKLSAEVIFLRMRREAGLDDLGAELQLEMELAATASRLARGVGRAALAAGLIQEAPDLVELTIATLSQRFFEAYHPAAGTLSERHAKGRLMGCLQSARCTPIWLDFLAELAGGARGECPIVVQTEWLDHARERRAQVDAMTAYYREPAASAADATPADSQTLNGGDPANSKPDEVGAINAGPALSVEFREELERRLPLLLKPHEELTEGPLEALYAQRKALVNWYCGGGKSALGTAAGFAGLRPDGNVNKWLNPAEKRHNGSTSDLKILQGAEKLWREQAG